MTQHRSKDRPGQAEGPEQADGPVRPPVDGPIPGFHAVVPAGGAGVRLWPLSRQARPKFLLDLTGTGRTLLQGTWDRLAPLSEGVLVVTGRAHESAVRSQLPGLGLGDVLAEPSGKDSMAAIGLAAAVLRERHGDVVLGSFAADHVISTPSAFAAAVREAVTVARKGYVVTIGLRPSRAATGFGYIELGDPLGVDGAPSVRRARSFSEKPDAATAAGYVAGGAHLWNAGMFVVTADTLLGHLRDQLPELADGLLAIARAWDTDSRDDVVARLWPELQAIAIDHAIAEPVAEAGGVAVVPAELGWDDVGDWGALARLLDPRGERVSVVGRRAPGGGTGGAGEKGATPSAVVSEDAAGSIVVPAGGRDVALLGVADIVVVDTPDALLVTTVEHAERLKDLVADVDPSLR